MKKIVSIGAIVEKSTMENKTGSWRTFKPIITEKCVACKRCIQLCPEGCMSMGEKNGKKIAIIDYDYCKGCLICASECPVKAIIKEAEI